MLKRGSWELQGDEILAFSQAWHFFEAKRKAMANPVSPPKLPVQSEPVKEEKVEPKPPLAKKEKKK